MLNGRNGQKRIQAIIAELQSVAQSDEEKGRVVWKGKTIQTARSEFGFHVTLDAAVAITKH